VLLVQLSHPQRRPAQSVDAPQLAVVGPQGLILVGEPDPRPARRVEMLDNGLHVAASLPRRHVAAGGGDRDHLELRSPESEANG
jgi:hypothetical protein